MCLIYRLCIQYLVKLEGNIYRSGYVFIAITLPFDWKVTKLIRLSGVRIFSWFMDTAES